MGGYERRSAPWALDERLLDAIPADFNGRLLEEDWPRFEEIAANSPQARAGDGRDHGHAADQRAGGIHARQRVLPRRERGARLLRRGGLLRPRPGGRRRDRQGDGAVDPRGRAGERHVGDGHQALRPSLPLAPLHARAHDKEVYETYYDIRYPGHERQAGRPLRTSSAYPWHVEHGAGFGEKSGWERVNWYESNAAEGDESLRPRGWAGMHWSPAIGAEHRATRERAGLFDESSFAKLEIAGPGAAAFLEELCDNRVAARGRGDHLHADAQPPRRHRVRLHRHPRRGGAVLDRHRHGLRQPRPELDPPPRARRRQRPLRAT